MQSAAATEVRVANREAMQRLSHGDLTSARFELDRAHEALALLESEASSEWLHNDSNVPSGANQSNAAVKRSQESSLGYLRSLTHNNDASWWRASGDLGRAVECLSKSLAECDAQSGVPLLQLASTHSNLCAVLSQVWIRNNPTAVYPHPCNYFTHLVSSYDSRIFAKSLMLTVTARWVGMTLHWSVRAQLWCIVAQLLAKLRKRNNGRPKLGHSRPAQTQRTQTKAQTITKE